MPRRGCCVAYSGQCLTSEAARRTQARTAASAQACRLPYEMIVDGSPRDLGDRAYLLSPQDLAAYDLDRPAHRRGRDFVQDRGPSEGRAATSPRPRRRTARPSTRSSNRKTLSSRGANSSTSRKPFSRGLTPGFLEGVNHQKLVRGRFPKSARHPDRARWWASRSRGDARRTVRSLRRPGEGRRRCALRHRQARREGAGGRVLEGVEALPGKAPKQLAQVELQFEANSIDYSQVAVGCDVYKTDDPAC